MAGNASSFTQARTDDMAQRLLYKIAVALGAVGPRLNDTAQRLTWKIVSALFTAGSNPKFAPRLDDTWQRLLWKWASLLFVSHGGNGGQQPRLDDTAQRLLAKIASLMGLPCSCSPSESQRLLYDIAAALQSGTSPAPAPAPTPTPIPCTLPSAPGDLGASAGNGQVTLTWPAGTGATGYKIYRSPSPGGGPWTLVGASATSPFVDNTVVNGTTYYYQVASTNSCGESVPGYVASHATPVAPPAAVTNLTAVYAVNTATQINLTWTDNATNEANYLIYQSIDGGAFGLIATIAANSTSYNDATPTASHTFRYKVAPVNAGGQTLSGAVTPTVASFLTTTTGAQTLTIASLIVSAAMTVDWGDGSTDSYNGANVPTHNYAGAGTWTVKFLSPLLVTTLNLSDNKITLNSSPIAPIVNVVNFLANGLKAGTFNSSDVSAWRPTSFYLINMPAGYTGTFNSSDVSAWRPSSFNLYLLPIGYGGTFNSSDVSAWRPTGLYIYSMPAGYSGNFNSSDVSAWRPVSFVLALMPTATFTNTITAGGFASWITTTTLDMSAMGLTQAQVNQILTDCYTAFPTRTATGGIITLNGAGNAAPSGTYQSACPPTSGKETAFDLLNDLCLINPTKTWSTITTN